MKKFVYWIDGRVNLIVILFLFWALFWGLNGGDKFLNGNFVPNTESWSAKGVLVDSNGEISYTLHPMETIGWFGVNRDSKMINYFKGIFMPPAVALFALYSIAIFEIVLGFTFLALFFWSLIPEEKQQKAGLMADRTIHRLAFKGSVCVFLIFSVGDILFGDRVELWEHGTFIVLCLITYDMWYRMDRFFIEQRQKMTTTPAPSNDNGSAQAASYQQTSGIPNGSNHHAQN